MTRRSETNPSNPHQCCCHTRTFEQENGVAAPPTYPPHWKKRRESAVTVSAIKQPETLYEYALAYADKGLEVFPCKPNKAPACTHGMLDATSDHSQIKAWWTVMPDALIGCRIPTDRIVLDIDPRHGGDKTIEALEEMYGPIPVARTHKSGRGDGGQHLWFERPPGDLSIKGLNRFAEQNGGGEKIGTRHVSGIDLLTYEYRYTILPPSPHLSTGKPYEWILQGISGPMPDWLAALLIVQPGDEDEEEQERAAPLAPQDSIAEWYTDKHGFDVLGKHGWTLIEGDGRGDGSKWRHPHATADWSASIKNGCLFVHSTNTQFEPTAPGDPHGYTPLHVLAVLEHDGDRHAAARAVAHERNPLAPHLDPSSLLPVVSSTAGSPTTPGEANTWVPTDLTQYLDTDYKDPVAKYLTRDDGRSLIYPESLNLLYGGPGTGKTWVALAAATQHMHTGGRAGLIDLEDHPGKIVRRLRALNATDGQILDQFAYIRPQSLDITEVLESMRQLAEAGHDLIIIDSFGELLSLAGLDENSNPDVTRAVQHLLRPITRLGISLLLIDHTTKSADETRGYSIGAQRKKAMIDGASWELTTTVPYSRTTAGTISIRCAKDRNGWYAPREHAADVQLAPSGDPDGTDYRLNITIETPTSRPLPDAPHGTPNTPTHLMEQISQYLQDCAGEPQSGRQIERAIGGTAAHIRRALTTLHQHDYVTRTETRSGWYTYTHNRTYSHLEELLPNRPPADWYNHE